jgi:hypothetical protein
VANRPLSVELRLINVFSCYFVSKEEHTTPSSRQLLSKRSDFWGAEELVQCSPFEGGRIRQEVKATVGRSVEAEATDSAAEAAPVRVDLRR